MKLYPQKRPYWFVDAKWVCGLLLIFTLSTALGLYALTKLTDEKHGSTIAALTVGSIFMRRTSATDLQNIKQEIIQRGGQVQPLPGFPLVVITPKDLDLPIRDLKLKVFKPLTDQIYQNGIEATAARYSNDPTQQQKFVHDATVFKIFTKSTHDTLSDLLIVFVIISFIFLVGLIYFSTGWGRLANPGLLLLLVSLPWTLLALALTHPPKGQTNDTALGFLPKDIAAELGDSLGHNYSRLTLLGVILLAIALIGKTFSAIHTRRSPQGSKASSETKNSKA